MNKIIYNTFCLKKLPLGYNLRILCCFFFLDSKALRNYANANEMFRLSRSNNLTINRQRVAHAIGKIVYTEVQGDLN